MKPSSWWWCALALAASSSAPAQQEPQLDLAPLVPAKPPAPAPAEKKKAPKKKRIPAAPKAQAQESQGALPPLALPEARPPVESQLPLAPLAPAPKPPTALGVVVDRSSLDADAATRIGDGLRTVAKLAPTVKEAAALASPTCGDDACWADAAAAQKLDQLVIASYAGGAVRLRLIDASARKEVSRAEQPASADALEAAATAEALLCNLLVPAGCTGEAALDAGEGLVVEVDGRALARGEKRVLPVGVHDLKLSAGSRTAARRLPVLREGAPVLYARQVNGEPRLLTAAELQPRPAVPVSALAAAPPGSQRKWTRTAGYAAAGAAVAVAAAGTYFGLKSKSEIDQAESAFRANGGAYRGSDLSALDSGNSKAHTANALFIASGVLLATAAVFTFAF